MKITKQPIYVNNSDYIVDIDNFYNNPDNKNTDNYPTIGIEKK